jgi:hypothetical protein
VRKIKPRKTCYTRWDFLGKMRNQRKWTNLPSPKGTRQMNHQRPPNQIFNIKYSTSTPSALMLSSELFPHYLVGLFGSKLNYCISIERSLVVCEG